MKALTIRQPYAGLIMAGMKRFETRDWGTKYRGKLAIHAAKTYDRVARVMAETILTSFPETAPVIDGELHLGCVMGIVELRVIYRTHEIVGKLSPLEVAVGNYEPGRAAWLVKVVDVFDLPVPAKGALGLWEWDNQ